MELVTAQQEAVDITSTPIHLGLGATARPIAGFAWDEAALAAYAEAVADDGPEGRLVMIFDVESSWTSWECHPAGEEVVVCLSGRMTMIQDIGGAQTPVELGPGEAVINPRGVWHTADVAEPGRILTITSGLGTDHRPR